MAKNITISFSISVLLIVLILMYQFNSSIHQNAKLDIGFGVIVVRYVLLTAALICIGLYFFKQLFVTNFFFVFISISNITLGIASMVLFFANQVIFEWLHQSLINMGIGVLMLIPVVLRKTTP